MQKVKKFSLIFPVLFVAGICYLLYIPLPTSKNPYHLYSTEKGYDLKEVLKKALHTSQKSIILHSYAITDPGILSLLKRKGEEGIKVHLYYHQKTTPFLHRLKGKNIFFHPIQEQGLMHEKIWIIDEILLFLGSTNLTPASLKMHHNLMIGLYAPSFATALVKGRPHTFKEQIKNKTLLYYSLPQKKALEALLKTLDQAKKTVLVSLFTFTHPTLLEKLIELHQKGIRVKVRLDRTSAQGASRWAKKRLEEENVPLKVSHGRELFHYKSADIDHKIFIIGSANWTKAAFSKNRDFILFIHNK